MPYNPDNHHRRSIRLRGYDYIQPGAYFVTICVQDGVCTFGEVRGGEVQLNLVGQVAHKCWQEIPLHYPQVTLDAFVIMPNHIHGIIGIIADGKAGAIPFRRDTIYRVPTHVGGESVGRFGRPVPGSLSTIVGTCKAAVTRICRADRYPPFKWQSRFYEHIIRNDRDLARIREYVSENPARWHADNLNPANIPYQIGR